MQIWLRWIAVIATLLVPGAALAQVEEQRVQFAPDSDGNSVEGEISGDYRVRVYLLGNQAPTTYRLEVSVTDSASDAAPAAESTAYRAG